MKTEYKVIILTFLLLTFFWIADATLTYIMFLSRASFNEDLINQVFFNQLSYRLMSSLFILLFGAASTVIVIKNKRETEIIKRDNDKYNNLFNYSNDATFMIEIDPDGNPERILEVNDIACVKLGYTRSEMLNISPSDILKVDVESDYEKELNEPIEEDKEPVETVMINSKGIEIPVEIKATLFQQDDHTVALTIARDLTERKQIEKALYKSEDKFKKLVHQFPEGIVICNSKGEIVEWNKGAEEIFEINKENAIGKKIWDIQYMLTPEEQKTLEEYENIKFFQKKVLETGSSIKVGEFVERKIETPLGKIKEIQILHYLIKAEEGFMICSISQDISEVEVIPSKVTKTLKTKGNISDFIRVLMMKKTIHPSLTEGLKLLLDISGANKILIFENYEDPIYGLYIQLLEQTCLEYKGIIKIEEIKIPYKSKLNRWKEKMSHGECINGLVNSFPEAEREFINSLGIQSILIIPMWIEEEWVGFVIFGNTESTKIWNIEDIDMLFAAVEIIGGYIKRREFELDLRKSEEKYKFLFEESRTANFIIGPDEIVIDANRFSTEITGYSKEEIIGMEIFNFIITEHKDLLRQQIMRGFNGEKTLGTEVDILDKDGNSHTLFFSPGQVLIKDRDTVLGILLSGVDITELKKTKIALNIEKEQLNVTLWSLAEGVITTDMESRIILMNRVAEKLTGWNENEVKGRFLNEIFRICDPKTRNPIENLVSHVIRNSNAIHRLLDSLLISRDGVERLINYSTAPIKKPDDKITGVVIVFRDITKEKIIEQEFIKASHFESLSLLSSGIAHDFNNILMAVMGNISMAKMLVNSSSRIYTILNEAEAGSLRAKELTEQLTAFAKGKTTTKKKVPLKSIILNSAELILRGSNIRCNYSLPSNLRTVEVDPGQFGQVLQNLIINGQQAMPYGGVIDISAENVYVSIEDNLPLQSGDYVKIIVKDNGTGIAPNDISKIFDPFYTTKKTGSGLGLAITYNIVKKHNGHINVQSELGKGAAFSIFIPALGIEAEPEQREEKKLSLGSGRILVMDDDPTVRDVLGLMLKHLGYICEFSSDGSELLEMYQKAMDAGRPFDVVIMDLTVPGGMGGVETIPKLLKIDPDAKAIVSSGYSSNKAIVNYKEYGFKNIAIKPYRIQELGEILKRTILM